MSPARKKIISGGLRQFITWAPETPPARNVTSPGGPTAALKILMADNGIQKIFDKALAAATNKGGELSK
jgi:pyrroline-5-carboxylate reductase